MLTKIDRRHPAGDQMRVFIQTAEQMIEQYGWQDMTIAPYGHAEPLTKILGWLKDYDRYTAGSKETLVQIANGMADVLNAWEEHQKSRTVRCLLLRGKHKGEERMFEPWMAEMLVEDGAVKVL